MQDLFLVRAGVCVLRRGVHGCLLASVYGEVRFQGDVHIERFHCTFMCSSHSCYIISSYPDERPEVYVSSDSLTRRGQDDLNADLKQFKMTLPLGEVCLLTIAEWVKDNAGSYFPIVSPQPNTSKSAGRGGRTFCRLWLYMHHIYSKTKRRNILDLADQLQLSGFCLPGKPGVVCVEGDEGSTRDFFNVLRRWNWKSISCRHREEEVTTECGDLSSHRRVEGFGELGLATHGPRGDHMDMGQFRTYLEKHSLGHVFPILFGVEGQTS